MANETTYQGGCHCGKVRYEVKTELGQIIACNCSICAKKGYLLTFVSPEQFALKSGEDKLTDYQFNKMNVHHKFCSVCGIGSFGQGKGPGGKNMVAINARCLDGVDLDKLDLKHFDGKSL